MTLCEARRKVYPNVRALTIFLGSAAMLLCQGCNSDRFRLGRSAPPQPEAFRPAVAGDRPMITESERPSELGHRENAVTLQITFELLRVDLPIRGMRHSLKIWNHVDETRAGPSQTALLARNGLRMGAAPVEAWPALRALFEANDARSVRARHAVQSGAPVSVRLGEIEEAESFFEYRRDGSLVGRTFDCGTRFLHIDYALDPADPARTRIRVTPEVRKFGTGKHWQNIDGRLREVPRYEGRIFSDLSAELAVGPGEFLVIGPSETACLESLVGSRFLTSEQNNVTYETVICLTPRPVRVDRYDR